MISDIKSPTLRAIMEEKIVQDSIVHSDTRSSYNIPGEAAFRQYWINYAKLLPRLGL
jgi:transposase-like protein